MGSTVASCRSVAALVLLAAVAAVSAHVQCQVSAGGQVFDLSKANNGNDVTVAMGSTGYNAVLNSCKPISSYDSVICQNGTLACQKAASSGAAFKALARVLTTSTYNGASLIVTYDNGDYCPTPNVNRKVVISYTCNQSPTTGNPTYVNENPSCQYNFNWASPAGCGSSGTVAPTTPVPTTPRPTTPVPTTPAPTTATPPGNCQLVGTWRAQYYDLKEAALLVEDETIFSATGEFEQLLEPYPSDCEPNQVTWTGDYIQFNQTVTRMSFINCGIDQRGCLNCTPTVDLAINTKFRTDCSSFVWSSNDIDDVSRTYYLVDSTAAQEARLAPLRRRQVV